MTRPLTEIAGLRVISDEGKYEMPRPRRKLTRFEREAKERIGEQHWKILTAVANGKQVSHSAAVTRASRPDARGN